MWIRSTLRSVQVAFIPREISASAAAPIVYNWLQRPCTNVRWIEYTKSTPVCPKEIYPFLFQDNMVEGVAPFSRKTLHAYTFFHVESIIPRKWKKKIDFAAPHLRTIAACYRSWKIVSMSCIFFSIFFLEDPSITSLWNWNVFHLPAQSNLANARARNGCTHEFLVQFIDKSPWFNYFTINSHYLAPTLITLVDSRTTTSWYIRLFIRRLLSTGSFLDSFLSSYFWQRVGWCF